MAYGSFNFFSFGVFEEKSPYGVVRHVLISFIKRVGNMVFASGQNEVLLLLLSLFLMLRNDVCFKSSNCRWASCFECLLFKRLRGMASL